ncbi:hypothetical protein EN784_01400 [bacterium M00.F.Ca.ET.141.01.1.1]|nr:hypothetical protein EOA35_25745 [Mesorhizobium sp. M8A.F.Ca.ET.023.01.1.1]RWC77730.1 MAG: hypothetical protein EOS71_00345 [Mesorhizobium sp.]TGV61083.1 hypothetical protein EN784_01400 [bacterium M00.F.Ca.ET.141.01.1.1]
MSPRNSRVTSTHVEYGFWLVYGEAGGVRLTRTEPSPDRAERSMFIQANLPRSLWRTATLRAMVNVRANAAGDYDANIEAAAEALRYALGVDIDLRVIPPA